MKNFAFSSHGLVEAQQKTILGIASFFNYHEDVRTLIVSSDLRKGLFSNLINQEKIIPVLISQEEEHPMYCYGHNDHFDFLDFNELIKINKKLRNEILYEELIRKILEQYDMVLWDTPNIERINQENEIFFPVSMKFESITLIVKESESQFNQILEIKSFFQKYGLKIKGVLFDQLKKKTS